MRVKFKCNSRAYEYDLVRFAVAKGECAEQMERVIITTAEILIIIRTEEEIGEF